MKMRGGKKVKYMVKWGGGGGGGEIYGVHTYNHLWIKSGSFNQRGFTVECKVESGQYVN